MSFLSRIVWIGPSATRFADLDKERRTVRHSLTRFPDDLAGDSTSPTIIIRTVTIIMVYSQIKMSNEVCRFIGKVKVFTNATGFTSLSYSIML